MLQLGEIMQTDVPACGPSDSLEVAAGQMWSRAVGCVVVVDGQRRPVAMVTDRDIAMSALLTGRPLQHIMVSECMSRGVHSAGVEQSLSVAERIMREHHVHRVPVVDSAGTLVGLVSLADVAKRAAHDLERPRREVCTEEVAVTLAGICAQR